MKFKLLILGLIISMPFSVSIAYADYLTPPVPVMIPQPMFAEPVPCCQPPVCGQGCYYKKYKKHHVRPLKSIKSVKPKRHHVRHYRRRCYEREGIPVCVYSYYPQPEPVAFLPGDSAGRRINLIDCSPYDPDLTTGDDDPTIYPGMNINN